MYQALFGRLIRLELTFLFTLTCSLSSQSLRSEESRRDRRSSEAV